MTAIKELGMGTNSKLHVQFKHRFWHDPGSNGNTYADTGYQNTWEVSRAQAGHGRACSSTTRAERSARASAAARRRRGRSNSCPQIEPVLPGTIATHWTGRRRSTTGPATSGRRARTPTGRSASTRSSPAWRGRGRATATSAGEHTSQDFQGYLNGAVETGERAVDEILGDLKHA